MEISDYKLHIQAINYLTESLTEAKKRQSRQCELLVKKINELEGKMQVSTSEIQINSLYEDSKKNRELLVKNLILGNKIEQILHKNELRLSQISKEIDINSNPADKGEFEAFLKGLSQPVTSEELGLSRQSDIVYNFGGDLIFLVGGMFDLGLKQNLDYVKSISEDKLRVLFKKFPNMCQTLPDSELIDTGLRVKLLKTIASYIFDEIRDSSIAEINQKMGSPLLFKYEIVDSFETFVIAISNLFKVKVKKFLREKYPSSVNEINKALVCNENLKILPEPYYSEKVEKEESTTDAGSDIDAVIDEYLSDFINGDNKDGKK